MSEGINSPETKPPRLLSAVLVGLGVFVLLGFTIRDYGLSTDEPIYIRNNHAIIQWVRDFQSVGLLDNLSEERRKNGWRFARPENKNLTLVSIVSTLGWVIAGRLDSFPAAFRWGNVFVIAATCGVMFHWIRTRYSHSAAWIAILALLGTPRLFAQLNLAAIDPLVGCFWVLASWALVKSRDNWRWAIAFGVLAGIGATSKPTFWFAVPTWILWGLFHRPRELGRPGVCLLTFAPLTAFLLSPMFWSNPVAEFVSYLKLLGTDATGWKIGTYYFGEIYQTANTPPVPWHAVIVMTAVTTPLWILALAGLGSWQAVKRFRQDGEDGGLWLMSAAALPIICMLPTTPNHDGLRLYRAAFFFLPLLSACGWNAIWKMRLFSTQQTQPHADNMQDRPIAWAALAGLIVLTIWQSARIHPGQLSYYNITVGGLSGAASSQPMPPTLPERNRPRFEIAYWWAAMNNDAFEQMQSHIPQGGTLWVFPQHDGFDLLRKHGQFREDIQLVQPSDQPQFTLLYGRLGSLADPNAAPLATIFLHRPAVWELKIDGVRVAALFRRDSK